MVYVFILNRKIGIFFTMELFLLSPYYAHLVHIFPFFFITNYASLYFAYDFDIPAFLNIDGINFHGKSPSNWSRDAFITIILSIPLAGMIIGIISLLVLILNIKKSVSFTLILIWIVIFSFNSSMGILINDAIGAKGTYEVARLMNISNLLLVAMSVIYAFILLKIGIMISKIIMLSFGFLDLHQLKNRLVFFLSILIFPWFAAVYIFNLLINEPFSWSFVLINLPVIFLLIPIITGKKPINSKVGYSANNGITPQDIVLTIASIMLSAVFVMLMQKGIMIN